MRKVYLCVALAASLCTGTASAQHSSQKVSIGIKGGLNIYTFHDNNDYDLKLGFNAGLLAHVHLVPHLGLQPEIVYSQQGVKGTGAAANVKNSLDYINVPVLVQYMFDNGFRLEAGPQVGFLLSAKQKVGSSSSARDIKDNFKSADIGLAAGISYVAPSTGFGVDLRYNLGLTNINNTSSVKQTNRGGQIGVFYLFHHRH